MPKPESEQQTMRGLRWRSCSYVSPRRPGWSPRRFEKTMSETATSFSKAARPSSDFRSSEIERLLRLKVSKKSESSPSANGGT